MTETFSGVELLNKQRLDFSARYSKVAICGMPRSGTTLLQYMMRCFEKCLVIPGEAHSALISPLSVFSDTVVVTKAPGDLEVVNTTLKIWPNTYFFIMQRDPRDLLCSRMENSPVVTTQAGIPQHGYAHENDAAKILDMIEKYFKLTEEALQLHGGRHCVVVRYRDLVSIPDKVQEGVAHIIGLKVTRRFSEYYKIPDIPKLNAGFTVRPIGDGSVGQWRKPEHREWMTKVLSTHREQLLRLVKTGAWDEDDSWVEELQ